LKTGDKHLSQISRACRHNCSYLGNYNTRQ